MSDPSAVTVTVVIPVLDDAGPLGECLAHLARQSRRAEEVLVVDNGSTDGSAELARAWGARVVAEPVRGIPAAAATGYDAAWGSVIVRCDADTRAPEGWLERMAAAFEADPGLDAVTGPGLFYDPPGLRGRVLSAVYMSGYRWAAGSALAGTPLWGTNFALRAEAWESVRERVHRDRADVHDDLDLSFRLHLDGRRVQYLPQLRVGAAGRMFRSRAQVRRQFSLAAQTLRLNWAELSPGQRWVQRLQRVQRDRARR